MKRLLYINDIKLFPKRCIECYFLSNDRFCELKFFLEYKYTNVENIFEKDKNCPLRLLKRK